MRNGTILMVDDNPDDGFLLERALRSAGLTNRLHVVNNGRDAIAYLEGTGKFADRERYPFPVLSIVDLHLPVASGFEVLNWIRDHPAFRPARVVACSGSAGPQDIRRAYDTGVEQVFMKPLEFMEYCRIFENIRGAQVVPCSEGIELVFAPCE